MSKHNGRKHGRLADMSVPPELRLRKPKTPRTRKAVPAQMDHGNGSKAAKLRKTGEAKLRRQQGMRRARPDPAGEPAHLREKG